MHPTIRAYIGIGITSSEKMLEHARLRGEASFLHVQAALAESAGNIVRLLGFNSAIAAEIHSIFGPFDFAAAKLLASIGHFEDGPIEMTLPDDFKNWKAENKGQEKEAINFALYGLKQKTKFPPRLPETESITLDLVHFFKNNPVVVSKINSTKIGEECLELVRQLTLSQKKGIDPSAIIVNLDGGWKWVNLDCSQDDAEGLEMQHCGTDSRGHLVSLRDPKDNAHVTMTYNKDHNMVYQIKGKQNASPAAKYWPAIKSFFDKTGAKNRDRHIANDLKVYIADAMYVRQRVAIADVGDRVWIENPTDDGVFLLVTKKDAKAIFDDPGSDISASFKSATLADGDNIVYPDEGALSQAELDELASGLSRLTGNRIVAYKIRSAWTCPDCDARIDVGQEYPGPDDGPPEAWDRCPECYGQLPWNRGEHEGDAQNESLVREGKPTHANSIAMAIVLSEPPGKNICRFIRSLVPNRTKVIVGAQPGSLSTDNFERMLRAAMPDVEAKLRVVDGGQSIAQAISSAESGGHYLSGKALEVFADPQLVRGFSQDASGGSLDFDPTVIMVVPFQIPSDDAEGIRSAVAREDLAAMERVLDPHLFSDADSLQQYKDVIKAISIQPGAPAPRESLTRESRSNIGSRKLDTKRLDSVLRAELGDTYPELEYLGSGRNGSAYRSPDGLVLKVTTDLSEVESCSVLRGLECEYIHRVHEVLFTDDPGVWIIVQEGGLERLPREYCEEFDLAMEILETIGAGHALRAGDFDGVNETMLRCGHPDLCLLVAEVMQKFDVADMLAELARLGLTADFHSGNIMLRGGCPVLIDLGTSSSGSRSVAIREEASTAGSNIVYHGSNRRIDQPKPLSSANIGTDYGPGMYFTTDPKDAQYYGMNVYQAKVSLSKPFVVTDTLTPEMIKIKAALRIDDEYMEPNDENPWHTIMGLAHQLVEVGQISWMGLIKYMRKLGYDGIVVPNSIIKSTEGGSHIKGDYVITFDTAQVQDWKEYVPAKGGSSENGRVSELAGVQAAPQAGPTSSMRGSNSSAWAGGRMVLSNPEKHVPEDENETERDGGIDQDIVGGGLDWGIGLNKRGF